MRSIAITLIALVALAGAASATAVRGDMEFQQGVVITGSSAISATSNAALDLAGSANTTTILWANASGQQLTQTRTSYGTGPVYQRFSAEPERTQLAWGNATLESIHCQSSCKVLAFLNGGSGLVGLSGSGPIAVKRLGASEAPQALAERFLYTIPAEWIVATDAPSAPDALTNSTLTLAGRVSLFFVNATATVVDGDGQRTNLDTRASSRPLLVGSTQVGYEETASFITLQLEGASIVSAGPGTRMLSAEPTIAFTGALAAPTAIGMLIVDGEPRQLDGASLLIEGVLGGRFHFPTGGVIPLLSRDESLEATGISGNATLVVIGGQVAVDSARDTVLAVAGGITLAALVAGALAYLKLFGFAPFYPRIERSSALRNPNRRAVYEAVQQNPGANTADLVRATALTEIVVRHHIKMLIQHRYIAQKVAGKTRGHFALDGETDPRDTRLHLALKVDTRRRVAEEIAAATEPVSQKELAEHMGLSQRLISYHVTHLENEGLIVGEGTMPRRFRATAPLQSFLEPAAATASA